MPLSSDPPGTWRGLERGELAVLACGAPNGNQMFLSSNCYCLAIFYSTLVVLSSEGSFCIFFPRNLSAVMKNLILQ